MMKTSACLLSFMMVLAMPLFSQERSGKSSFDGERGSHLSCLLPSQHDTLTVQCHFKENPFELTLTFEFEDDSTEIVLLRNYGRVERSVCSAKKGSEKVINISQYGSGTYIVRVTPKDHHRSLGIIFGYDEEPVGNIDIGGPDADVEPEKRDFGELLWHANYAEQGNQMIVYANNESAVGTYWNQYQNMAERHYSCHSSTFAGLCFPEDTYPWYNFEGRGLHVWGEGTASVCELAKGDILEFVYDSDYFTSDGDARNGFYTTDHTQNPQDDGAAKKEILIKKPTRRSFGYAVYEILEDGNVGFGLVNNGAIREINIYKKREQSDLKDVLSPEFSPLDVQRFDLQGRRVQGQPRSGLYIRDGRKTVVK